MWTAAMYEIMRAEKFWCDPDILEQVMIKLGRDDGTIPPWYIADCSCTPMEGHTGHGKGRGQQAANGLWYVHTSLRKKWSVSICMHLCHMLM